MPNPDSLRDTQSTFACTECPYVFTQAEINREDPTGWGHPCHFNDERGNCESFRKPVGESLSTQEQD